MDLARALAGVSCRGSMTTEDIAEAVAARPAAGGRLRHRHARRARHLCVIGAPPAGTEAAFDVQGLLPGKQIVGVTLGDGDPEALLPLIVELHRRGQLPLDRLVRHDTLDELDQAATDTHHGATVRLVVRF